VHSSFSSTRLQEHAKENKQHKQAKQVFLFRKFSIAPISDNKISNNSDFIQLANLFEFILFSVKNNFSINSISYYSFLPR